MKSFINIKIKHPIICYFLFTGILLFGVNLQAQILCYNAPSTAAGFAQCNENIARTFAPTIYQSVSDDTNKSLNGNADRIVRANYDNDWNTLNNWENAGQIADLNSALPHGYYHVIWTDNFWIVEYTFYWARDYGTGPCSSLGSHEGDADKVIVVVARPEDPDTDASDLKLGVIVSRHGSEYGETCIKESRLKTVASTDPFIGGGQTHPLIGCAAGSHAFYHDIDDTWKREVDSNIDGDIFCNPKAEFRIVYRPGVTASKVPFPDYDNGESFSYESYTLEDVVIHDGLWDRREDLETFPLPAKFGCNNHNCGGNIALASAPWNGARGSDPIEMLNDFFKIPLTDISYPFSVDCECRNSTCEGEESNLIFEDETYVYNPFLGCEETQPFSITTFQTFCMDQGRILLASDLSSPTAEVTWILPPGIIQIPSYPADPPNTIRVDFAPGASFGNYLMSAIENTPPCFPKSSQLIFMSPLPQPSIIINDLPTSSSTTYNFGVEDNPMIPSVDINAGGTLRVNNLGPTGYIPGNGLESDQKTFYANILSCDGSPVEITIHDGGRFILGNDSSGDGSRKAIVNVAAGNTVHIKAGATLRLARGSQLIIEEGAKLIIEEGALIDLWWSDSSIRVNGELELQGEFEFTGSGFFQFDPDHTLTLTSQFKLEGQSIDHRFLRISDGTTLDINNHYLNLKSGTIEYGHGAKIRIGAGGKVSAFWNVFTSTQAPNQTTGIGLLLDNPDDVNIQFSRFENLFYGIEINGLPGMNTLDLNYVWFNNNIIGIFGHTADNVTISNSFFDAKNDGLRGIELRNISNLNIQGNTFNNYPSSSFGTLYLKDIDHAQVNSSTFSDNQNSIYLTNVYNFEMNGGWITNSLGYSIQNTIGIRVPIIDGQNNVTNLSLGSNAQIKYQGIGIEVEKGGIINNSTEVYGKVKLDCAKLINNKRSIKGEDVTLAIDAFVNCNCSDITEAKPNTFIRSAYANAGEKHIEICYDQLSVSEILANGNFWSDGTSTNGITIRDCNSQTTNIPLIRDENVDSEPSGCSSGGNGPPTPQDNGKDRGEASTDSKDTDTNALTIYPNPTNGQFSIVLSAGEYSVRIFDMTGKEVFNQTSMTANNAIDANDWTRGLYIVKAVEHSTNVQSHAKLLIQ